MTIREMQDEIVRLKKEKDFCILGHAYQSQDILEVSDFVGDSYGLAKLAKTVPEKNIMMCGVRFMAETVKMLSPEKNVYLANPVAGCPMAEQVDGEFAKALREKYPDYTIVAYINTTSETKRYCDVCVTSSSALKIIKNIQNDKIVFIPDLNLGTWIKNQCPEKHFEIFHGCCPTHMRATEEEAKIMKEKYPDALLLVHPECRPEVVALADYVGSTTGIMKYAEESDAKEFIIGTEGSIVEHLEFSCPDKKFHILSKELYCHNMRSTTLADVYNTLLGNGGEEMVLSSEVMTEAIMPIDEMIRLGG